MKEAKILKILGGTIFHLLGISIITIDCETKNVVVLELSPPPKATNYFPILKVLSDATITY